MSKQLINEYRAELDRLRAVSGSRRESVLREAFKDLLKRWGRAQDLTFVPEHEIVTPQKNRIYLDGALLHALRVPFGYWEAKDADDDLDAEIAAKFRSGYPRTNTIFSDDRTAVLYQDGTEAVRVPMDDPDALLPLLQRFFAHEREEVADFNRAVKRFAADLPAILEALRERIAEKHAASAGFAAAVAAFLQHARDAINPAVTEDDVREMLIQHILTEDIFAKVFNDPDFHRKNNVAAELYKLEGELFGYGEKATLLKALGPYYSGIASTAALIDSHSEKQGFLKVLYEDFYKAYNRKAADRLGVVYTPGEIVRFMIRSADWLCETHWGKNLIDPGVEILDPATGTGTFIVELLEHFRGDHAKLRHKYKEELHANEVAILPYYVANLNIEATYEAITGQFAEFPNLCLVDTLDNVAALGIHAGHQFDLLGGLADENMERVRRQNRRKISVIIGNPPYNANQQSENDNNKNRVYAHVDRRIKETYIKASMAQKTKLYDMYVRFFRWASDRLGDEGIVIYITNRSFIDAYGADGFRKSVLQDFCEGWIVDLGGDYKKKGVGGAGNVFGIGTGVAISIWVKRRKSLGASTIRYLAAPAASAEDKLSWICNLRGQDATWRTLDRRLDGAWIDLPEEDLVGMMPLISRATKAGNSVGSDRAIFRQYSLGISTNRDEWIYGETPELLEDKMKHFIATYDTINTRVTAYGDELKWSRNLKRRLAQNRREPFDRSKLVEATYRPFTKRWLYQSSLFIDEVGLADRLFPAHCENKAICFSDPTSQKPFLVSAVSGLVDLHFVGAGAGTIYSTRYRYTASGERVDNITDWALAEFRRKYGNAVTKDAIFLYIYAVLHDPAYRKRYALNLRREFPRVPLYPDFTRWVTWGEALMRLHIGYEEVDPWPVRRIDVVDPKRATGIAPRPILKSQPDQGSVRIDADTQLTGIPPSAWGYHLGNRAALDWILDQHKEKTPRDPTIRERFNMYRFADHKEAMIALVAKVVRVSVETVAIIEAMHALSPEARGEEAAEGESAASLLALRGSLSRGPDAGL